MWTCDNVEDVAVVADNRGVKPLTPAEHIAELERMGYTVQIKEKEPTSAPTKVTDVSTNKNIYDMNKDNTKQAKSQELERYTMMDIKMLYEYDSLIVQYPAKQTDIDVVFDILYDTLNSTKQMTRVCGEDKPTMAVIGRLMKLQPDDLIYSIDKYHEQTDRIKNVKGYLLTILYNSREQNHLDIMNLGHHNGDFWYVQSLTGMVEKVQYYRNLKCCQTLDFTGFWHPLPMNLFHSSDLHYPKNIL